MKFPPFIFDLVFEFRGVGGNFLVGEAGIEASMDAIFLDFADDAFVGVVFLVFPAIGRDLKVHDLNQSLNFLFVYDPTTVLEFQVDPSIAVVFVVLPNGQDVIF